MATFGAQRRVSRSRAGKAEAAIPRARLVKKGSTDGGLALNGATDTPLGAALNVSEKAIGEPVEYSPVGSGDAVELTASAALDPGAEFIGAANGKIAPVPTEGGGTKDALGKLDAESVAATADGDMVIGRLYDTPITRTIPS
jgi:hypothetical protein